MKANETTGEEIVLVQQADLPVVDETVECVGCKYDAALELISAAIESLAEIAKDDIVAKDSIANLGVVMLDLKGACNCE